MAAFLKIANPGVAPAAAFTLLGASSKRGSESGATIGKFGTGNKHGVAVMLRAGLKPVVFAGQLKMEFDTRQEPFDDGLRTTMTNRVTVKYGGKDIDGKSRTATEDLGFVLEHGSTDWDSVDLALREFVSNALDRAADEDDFSFIRKSLEGRDATFKEDAKVSGSTANRELADLVRQYRLTAKPWENVTIEVVEENQVRAKAGETRIFIPLTEAVLKFYNNLGKWFLHFSEPEMLNQTILPKSNRNIGDRRSAVIYRRGVRVREFESSDTPSLFDYNLENLKLDESRKVDDWYVQHEAAKAFANAGVDVVARIWQSFMDGGVFWEHSFNAYGLENGLEKVEQKAVWVAAFEKVAGEKAVMAVAGGGELAARKGYTVVTAPEQFVVAAEKRGIPIPSKVLSADEQLGRTIMDSTADAEAAVDFAWDLCVRHGVTNGRSRPVVKTFRKIMDGGSQTLGFYKGGVVHINQDIAGNGAHALGWHGLTQQLLVTALEEVAHHVTGALDNSRDFQDFFINLIVYMAKEKSRNKLTISFGYGHTILCDFNQRNICEAKETCFNRKISLAI